MLQALVFDFGGTILDTEKAESLRWQALYREQGLTLELAERQQGNRARRRAGGVAASGRNRDCDVKSVRRGS